MIINHSETLARHEERLAQGEKRMDSMEALIWKADERVDKMDKLVDMLVRSNSFMNKVLWALAGAAGTIITTVIVTYLVKLI